MRQRPFQRADSRVRIAVVCGRLTYGLEIPGRRFQCNVISGGVPQILTQTEIDLGCGQRRVAEAVLNLFDGRAAGICQLGKRAPQIVRGNPQTGPVAVRACDFIDCLCRNRRSRNLARLVDCTEQAPRGEIRTR